MKIEDYNENLVPLIYHVPDILSNLCGLVGIMIFLYKLTRILKLHDNNVDWLNGIWFAGLLAFLIRLAEQLYLLWDMFNAISKARGADVNAIVGGLSRITLSSLKGLIILITLLILWGLLKGLITYRKTKAAQVHKR
jgi:hypothetical protein